MFKNVMGLIATAMISAPSLATDGFERQSKSPLGSETIKCESYKKAYQECKIPGGHGRMVAVDVKKKLSSADCTYGQDWGTYGHKSPHTLWVNHGCRAKFDLIRVKRQKAKKYVACESHNKNNSWHFSEVYGKSCQKKRATIQTLQHLSYEECETKCANRKKCEAFSFDFYKGKCHLKKQCKSLKNSSHSLTMIKTFDADHQVCRLKGKAKKGSIKIAKQLSKTDCFRGVHWGVHPGPHKSIWVDHGCRAIFEYKPKFKGGSGRQVVHH